MRQLNGQPNMGAEGWMRVRQERVGRYAARWPPFSWNRDLLEAWASAHADHPWPLRDGAQIPVEYWRSLRVKAHGWWHNEEPRPCHPITQEEFLQLASILPERVLDEMVEHLLGQMQIPHQENEFASVNSVYGNFLMTMSFFVRPENTKHKALEDKLYSKFVRPLANALSECDLYQFITFARNAPDRLLKELVAALPSRSDLLQDLLLLPEKDPGWFDDHRGCLRKLLPVLVRKEFQARSPWRAEAEASWARPSLDVLLFPHSDWEQLSLDHFRMLALTPDMPKMFQPLNVPALREWLGKTPAVNLVGHPALMTTGVVGELAWYQRWRLLDSVDVRKLTAAQKTQVWITLVLFEIVCLIPTTLWALGKLAHAKAVGNKACTWRRLSLSLAPLRWLPQLADIWRRFPRNS